MRESNLKLLQLTFEAAGVIFEGNGETITGGIGVRMKN